MTLEDLRNNPEYWKKVDADLKENARRKEQAEDEYYQKLGELVEEHPIVSGKRL